jgi:diguanylate cyclase (GGDEF)-like protein
VTSPDVPDLAHGLAEIWERFKPTVEEQTRSIEDAAIMLLEGGLSTEARREAERNAHKLAGSAGTFGFAEASELAREAEGLLDASTDLGRAETLRLSEIAVALRHALNRKAEPTLAKEVVGSPHAKTASVLVLDGDRGFVQRLEMEGEGRGLRLLPVRTIDEIGGVVSREDPAAIVVDPHQIGTREPLRELTNVVDGSKVIVCSERHRFEDRLEAARHGIRFFLEKPISPSIVVDAIVRIVGPVERASACVMAVDDSDEILSVVQQALTTHGYRFVGCRDPLVFWETLRSEEPDILLLDADMPVVSGVDLCKVVRSDIQWGSLPIVFLTSSRDASLVARVFAAGADDYVTKPVIEMELLTRISNRLERVRLARQAADLDYLTGTMNRQRLVSALDQMIDIASSDGSPVAIASIDVDGLEAINRSYGSGAGDRLLKRIGVVLRRRAGREDAVGRWTGGRFVAGFFDTTKQDTVRLLADLAQDLRSEDMDGAGGFVASFSAGVAEIPLDGADLRAGLKESEAALTLAKEGGGGKVVGVGWRPGVPDPSFVDVVVVEDDAPLAGLLTHALETRGLTTRHIGDGAEAARLLGGEDPEIRTRAVILDVDLPGLDGLGVLRTLKQSNVLVDTKVVMLTVRAAEVEVLKAMELGAFDHVSKPFSVPVLMQRVERALSDR